MNAAFRDKAVGAMEKLLEHPCSAPFTGNSDLVKRGDKLNWKIPPGADLQSIIQKLRSGMYTRPQEWYSDMDRVWESVEMVGDKYPNLAACANWSKTLFNRERRAIEMITTQGWGTELGRVKAKLETLFTIPPRRVAQHAMTISGVRILSSTDSVDDDEMDTFINATEKLLNDEENEEIARMLFEMQPDLSGERIDITKLNKDTLQVLIKYARSALAARGVEYPI